MKTTNISMRTIVTALFCTACFTLAFAGNPLTKKQLAGDWQFQLTELQASNEEGHDLNGTLNADVVMSLQENGHTSIDLQANIEMNLEENGMDIKIQVLYAMKGEGIWALSNDRIANSYKDVNCEMKNFHVYLNGEDATETIGPMVIKMLKEQDHEDFMTGEVFKQVSTAKVTNYTGDTMMMDNIKLTRIKKKK